MGAGDSTSSQLAVRGEVRGGGCWPVWVAGIKYYKVQSTCHQNMIQILILGLVGAADNSILEVEHGHNPAMVGCVHTVTAMSMK